MPGTLLLLAALAAAEPVVVNVAGTVHDAALVPDDGGALWLARTHPEGGRQLVRLTRGGRVDRVVAVPKAAVAFDACPGRGVVFADGRGIVTPAGARLLEGAAALAVPDPSVLFAAPLCGRRGAARGELRLVVAGGVRVQHAGGGEVTLPFAPRARAYSGRAHRGLRAQRPYALALSLYAPHLFDADVDGDGRLDLVVAHEGRVGVFLRDEAGRLSPEGQVRDLQRALGSDAHVRVLPVDLTDAPGSELLLSVTEGAVPERSSAYLLGGAPASGAPGPRRLWQRSGLSVPLGKLAYGGREVLVIGEIDTNLVQLGAALVTGEVPLKVALVSEQGAPKKALTLKAEADVRAGKMAGAMPIVAVDLDGDGQTDLLDLGVSGKAALYPGDAGGLASKPSAAWTVPPFARAIPLPELPGVVLLGEPGSRSTKVTLLLGPAPER